MIWKIWKTIVKRYGKYGKQFWKDMENMEKRQVEMWNDGRKVSWIVKCYGKCGRKVSWIEKWYEKYGRKVSWNLIRYGKYGRKVKWYGTYGKQLWKDMENMAKRQVEMWNDM